MGDSTNSSRGIPVGAKMVPMRMLVETGPQGSQNEPLQAFRVLK
jgi:hypothetical protein